MQSFLEKSAKYDLIRKTEAIRATVELKLLLEEGTESLIVTRKGDWKPITYKFVLSVCIQ